MPRGKQKPKDEFVDWSVHALMFIRDNFKTILWAVVVAVAIFSLVGLGRHIYSYRTEKAADALYAAQKLTPESDEWRKELETIADDYGSTASGREAMMMLGDSLFKKGDFEAALVQYQNLADKSKGIPLLKIAALHKVAATERASGKIEDAAKTYLAAAEDVKNLNKGESYYLAARCFEDLKKYDNAEKIYKKIIGDLEEDEMKTKSEERLLWLIANGSISS